MILEVRVHGVERWNELTARTAASSWKSRSICHAEAVCRLLDCGEAKENTMRTADFEYDDCDRRQLNISNCSFEKSIQLFAHLSLLGQASGCL